MISETLKIRFTREIFGRETKLLSSDVRPHWQFGEPVSRPRISVIVPVHNAEAHLATCLDSILSQSEKRLEVICVDDGSDDGSLGILQDYAATDKRLTVIHQDCRGAGAARNRGLGYASGAYLTFLDSDDFFEASMLEDAADKMDEVNADIVAFGAWIFDTNLESDRLARWVLKSKNIPQSRPFSWRDMPDTIFNTFGNYTWNKLFRASFVKENHLEFQEISRTNDLLFVCSALVLAERIDVVDRPYVHYRMGSSESLQATNDRDPLSFFCAFKALKDFLVGRGLFSTLEKSFLDHALDGVIANTDSMKSLPGLLSIRAAIPEQIEPAFGFLTKPEDFYENRAQIEQYKSLFSEEPQDYLFGRTLDLKNSRERLYWYLDWSDKRAKRYKVDLEEARASLQTISSSLEQAQRHLNETRSELDAVRSSKSFKIGVALTAPWRHMRQLIRKHR